MKPRAASAAFMLAVALTVLMMAVYRFLMTRYAFLLTIQTGFLRREGQPRAEGLPLTRHALPPRATPSPAVSSLSPSPSSSSPPLTTTTEADTDDARFLPVPGNHQPRHHSPAQTGESRRQAAKLPVPQNDERPRRKAKEEKSRRSGRREDKRDDSAAASTATTTTTASGSYVVAEAGSADARAAEAEIPAKESGVRDASDAVLNNDIRFTAASSATEISRDAGASEGARGTERAEERVVRSSANVDRLGASSRAGLRVRERRPTGRRSKAERAVEHADSLQTASRVADVDREPGGPNGTSYLLRRFTGRLGNVLFELASAFCVARLNNLTLVVKDVPQLADVNYRGLMIKQEGFEALFRRLRVVRHSEAFCCSFDPNLMTMKPRNRHHYIRGYMTSWKYFEPCKDEVRRAIAFKDNVVRKAAGIVGDLRKKHPGATLVGVHVRQEDYLSPRSVNNGKKVAPPDYYVRAMAYFRNTFDDVMFVVIVSNQSRFKNAAIGPVSDVLFQARSKSPAVDMEVLSRLDHVIMSVGTFGWWAAYRNNGTVVCYKDFYVPGSKYGKQILNNGTDFLCPGWIFM